MAAGLVGGFLLRNPYLFRPRQRRTGPGGSIVEQLSVVPGQISGVALVELTVERNGFNKRIAGHRRGGEEPVVFAAIIFPEFRELPPVVLRAVGIALLLFPARSALHKPGVEHAKRRLPPGFSAHVVQEEKEMIVRVLLRLVGQFIQVETDLAAPGFERHFAVEHHPGRPEARRIGDAETHAQNRIVDLGIDLEIAARQVVCERETAEIDKHVVVGVRLIGEVAGEDLTLFHRRDERLHVTAVVRGAEGILLRIPDLRCGHRGTEPHRHENCPVCFHKNLIDHGLKSDIIFCSPQLFCRNLAAVGT